MEAVFATMRGKQSMYGCNFSECCANRIETGWMYFDPVRVAVRSIFVN